jgi:hypothetical protein
VQWLRRERNEIFGAVLAGGLGLADCELEFRSVVVSGFRGKPSAWQRGFRVDPNAACILHPPSGSSFLIVEADGMVSRNGFTVFSVVPDGPSGRQADVAWEKLPQLITPWAREAQFIADNPDIWQQAKQQREVLSAAQQDQMSTLPFTPEERAEIASRLEAIKAEVREKYELTAEQISGVDQKLDDLREASERVGKKDWLVMVYGAAFGLLVNDAVPVHAVQGIITMAVSGLAHILGLGGVPPALPL